MTDITTDDEREVMDWITRHAALDNDGWRSKYARTLLALLDRPVLPRPEDVPDAVLDRMDDALNGIGQKYREAVRSAYRALYDHYTAPPAPKKVEAWGVRDKTGLVGTAERQDDAEAWAKQSAGRWVVRLVEADSHD